MVYHANYNILCLIYVCIHNSIQTVYLYTRVENLKAKKNMSFQVYYWYLLGIYFGMTRSVGIHHVRRTRIV